MARKRTGKAAQPTADTFQNFLARVGIGTGSIADGASYNLNPLTRNRTQLELIYRGSWIAGAAVDAIADDMTREGVELRGIEDPKELSKLQQAVNRLQIWPALNSTLKWSRLYGGALALLMIDGQRTNTPLRPETIRKGQFRGLLPIDRWLVQPSINSLVQEMGADFGLPEYYDTVVDTQVGLPSMKIHHSRVIRLIGVELPFWQRISEMLWGQSVIERLFDRLVAFDSTTQGAAQLVYKAHLRTLSVEGLRDLLAQGGPGADSLARQVDFIRRFQSNEGLTLIDSKDTFESHVYTFAGLDSVLLQFGQQLSGATGIPLVRLFGQSPAGLNSTGEADLSLYYDTIKAAQESRLRSGVERVYDLAYRSEFGREPPDDLQIEFNHLWQLDEQERAEVVRGESEAVRGAFDSQIIDRQTALRELQGIGRRHGVFASITSEQIEEAEDEPIPSPGELGLEDPDAAGDSGRKSPSAARTGRGESDEDRTRRT